MNTDGSVAVQRYAVFAVLRGALETAAVTWWIANPKVLPRQRLTFGLQLGLHSVRYRLQTRSVLAPNQVAQLEEVRRRLENTARHHKIMNLVGKLDSGSDVGIPNASQLIEGLFKFVPYLEPEAAVAEYGVLSEPMHGNMIAALAGYRHAMPSDEHHPDMLHPNVPIFEIVIGAHFAAAGAARAMQGFVELMGWDVDRWMEMSEPELSSLRTAAFIAHDFNTGVIE